MQAERASREKAEGIEANFFHNQSFFLSLMMNDIFIILYQQSLLETIGNAIKKPFGGLLEIYLRRR